MNMECIVCRINGSRRVCYPRGCIPGLGTVYAKLNVEELEAEERDGYCVVYSPVRAVLPGTLCKPLREIAEGKPRSLLLLGPPGLGKSTTLEIASRIFPGRVIEVDAESLLSKYVGETEENLRRILEEAEENTPSLILFDEGDMLVSKRIDAGDNVVASQQNNLVRMMLRWMSNAKKKNIETGVIVTSNRPLKSIDNAFIRAGRFDYVVVFRVPEPRAVKILAELYGKKIDDEEAAEIASSMMAFSNIVHYFKTGEKKEYQPFEWAKIIMVNVEGRRILGDRFVVKVSEEQPLAELVAAAVAYASFRKPVLVLKDRERLREAFYITKSMGIPVAIPYDSMYESEALMYASEHGMTFLLGKRWSLPMNSTISLDMVAARLGRKLYDALGCKRCRGRSDLEKFLAGINVF